MDKFKVDHNKIDDLSENMSQVFEATSQAYNLQKNVALSKGAMANDYDAWKEQMKGEKAKLKASFDKSNNQVSNIVKSATQETMKEAKKSDLQIKNELKKPTTNLIKEEGKAIKLFEKAVLKDFDEKVSKIYKLKNQEPLFDAIAKYTNEGGIANAPKITYANGRTISFKAYMEMNVRTTIRQEVNETLFEASKNNGVVFYLGNSFSDCAKDHLDYDGKMFYDKDWQSFGYDEKISEEIQAYIDANNLMTYQYATEQGFTTRPNCRHSLTPMTIDEVLGNSVNQLLKDNNLNAKSPRNDTNYLITQNQRYFERQIRQAKMSLEAHSLQQQNMPTTKMNELIANDKEKIAHYQKELRILMDQYGEKNGGFLKRDYRRENPAVVVQDAGVRYTMGIRGVSASKVSELIENKQVMEIKQEPVQEIKETKEVFNFTTDKLKETFDNPEQYIKAFNESAVKNDNEVNELLNKIGSIKVKLVNEKGRAGFSTWDLSISVKKSESDGTLFHELGHAMDCLVAKGKAKEGEKFKWLSDEIKQEVIDARTEQNGYVPKELTDITIATKNVIVEKVKEKSVDIMRKVSEKYANVKYASLRELMIKDEMASQLTSLYKKTADKDENYNRWACLSDIYDAIHLGMERNNEDLTGYHGSNYYMSMSILSTINDLGATKNLTEIFANYCEMRIGGYTDQMELFEKLSPKLKNKLDEVFSKMVKEL